MCILKKCNFGTYCHNVCLLLVAIIVVVMHFTAIWYFTNLTLSNNYYIGKVRVYGQKTKPEIVNHLQKFIIIRH